MIKKIKSISKRMGGKKTKIAINGFGRIGRLFLRQALNNSQLEIVAINDLGDGENLAYLLRYDTPYRKWNEKIEYNAEKKAFKIGGKSIKFISEKDPLKLPWKNLGIDIAIEVTGVFESYEKAKMHLDAGAKRVVLAAPAKDDDGELGKTILMGINEEDFKKCKISSNGSCTTNSASPVIQILAEKLGIEKAILTTIHSYTNTQTIVDSAVKGSDFRRGRAGAQNIIPSTTGAAIAVTKTIKELKGRFDGIAMRVPSITGSISDITFISKKKTSIEEVNKILQEAEKTKKWQGILKTTDEQIVSSDIIGESYGAIVDLKFTKVVDGNLVKVLSWYDNEWGYTAMLMKHVLEAAKNL